MEILIYQNIQTHKLKKQLDKTIATLKAGDFRSADVRKMQGTGFYRAKLDDTNRLLFKIGRYQEKTYLFILEVIVNHAYDKSRFLNGAPVDETKLIPLLSENDLKSDDLAPVGFVSPGRKTFHLLDKILTFDDVQNDILHLPLPLIVIGSAGSGKTALTLEKLKTLPGRILYTTLSPFLAENARNLYYSFGYENPSQEVDFLSFYEYLSTCRMPEGRELDFRTFDQWAGRYRQRYKIKDTYKLFEEFRGVLTGAVTDRPHLSEQDYLELGVKQSIFPRQERPMVYELFGRYLDWLKTGEFYDLNLAAFGLLGELTPTYDYVVVDEVQDITNVQLAAILKSLQQPSRFILCGDSNQIVHPNFFSWSQIKSLFYKDDLKGEMIRVLAANYRNTPEVTEIANKLLLVKNARFGSIDRESTYLIHPRSTHPGAVEFLENKPQTNADLDRKTSRSVKVAVVVLREEDKAEARRFFRTPLLFSVHEAKGLEYESIILFNTVSNYAAEFRELTQGVSAEDLTADSLRYSRARDKGDKSLDEYKFYVNALYVAITRAVKNLYVVEADSRHALLQLLGLTQVSQQASLKDQASSQEEWQQEARRLELQGKRDQAEAIRQQVLKIQPVPWEVLTFGKLGEFTEKALDPNQFNKKAKDLLFDYALYYQETDYFRMLSELKYRPADRWEQELKGLARRRFPEYAADNPKVLAQKVERYGLDFRNELNLTPYMLAVHFGAEKVLAYLAESGANTALTDNYGRSSLQMAILKAYAGDAAYKRTFGGLYHKLKTDSLSVKAGNRLVKLDAHQGEFLMLQYMLAVLRPHVIKGLAPRRYYYGGDQDKPAFQAKDFLDFFDGLPEQVLPAYRSKRTYVSGLLAKNEITGGDRYNKHLFVRVQLGHYLPNPLLEVMVEDRWVNVYDLIGLEQILSKHAHAMTGYVEIIQMHRQRLRNDPTAVFDAEAYWAEMTRRTMRQMLERE